jgi:hypothetical protein
MTSSNSAMRTDRVAGPVAPWRRRIAAVLLPVVLAACGTSSEVTWPGLRLQLPEGWEVLDQSADRLILADHLAEQGERGVTITFLRVPGTLPDDWRDTVAARGALLESDEGVLISGDVPATQLVLRDTVDGVPVREVLLVVASRGLVIAITPRLQSGEQDGPELLLESLDAVRALLDEVELAPPVLG